MVLHKRPPYCMQVPTMLYELVTHPDFNKYDTSAMQMVGGGGEQSKGMLSTGAW